MYCTDVGDGGTSHAEHPAPSDSQLACPACGGGEQARTGGGGGRDEKRRDIRGLKDLDAHQLLLMLNSESHHWLSAEQNSLALSLFSLPPLVSSPARWEPDAPPTPRALSPSLCTAHREKEMEVFFSHRSLFSPPPTPVDCSPLHSLPREPLHAAAYSL